MLFLHIFYVVILNLNPIFYIKLFFITFVSIYSNYGLYTVFIAKNKFFSISKFNGFISFILGYYFIVYLYTLLILDFFFYGDIDDDKFVLFVDFDFFVGYFFVGFGVLSYYYGRTCLDHFVISNFSENS